MPSSYPENIAPIIQMIAKYKPKSVMDIGVGRGKYGFLIKEYFHPSVEGEWKPVDKVDGLEIFPEYITDLQRSIYDHLYIGNALDFDFETYDMYLIIDVLEHWNMEEAYKVLDRLTKKGKVLISTPTNIGCQGAAHGNEWEKHVSQWLPPMFNKYKVIEDWSNDASFIFLLDKV